jgi:hypothetical protein
MLSSFFSPLFLLVVGWFCAKATPCSNCFIFHFFKENINKKIAACEFETICLRISVKKSG